MRARKFLATPTCKKYNDGWQRSMEVNASTGNVEALSNLFRSKQVSSGNMLGSISIARDLGNIVGLATAATNKIHIPHGWGTERLRFVLAVEENIGTQVHVTYLQGYTEYHDPSYSGYIDENMPFFINSIICVIETPGFPNVDIVGSYSLITDAVGGSNYESVGTNQGLSVTRPLDIITDLMIDNQYAGNDGQVSNQIGRLDGTAYLSSRSNSDGVKYFEKTVNSFIRAKATAGTELGDSGSIYANAVDLVYEAEYHDLPFIKALKKVTGLLQPTSFTLSQMIAIDPNTISVLELTEPGNINSVESATNFMTTDDTESTLQPTNENMIQLTVKNAVTSAMADNNIQIMDVSMTNMTGTPTVLLSGLRSIIDGMDCVAEENKIHYYLEDVIFPLITHNGQQMVTCFVTADMYGDTTVSVSIENDPLIVYRDATFADALGTPMVSSSVGKKSLVNNFSNVFSETY